jgi:PTH2 family peptidyl-tRNA hydrolase
MENQNKVATSVATGFLLENLMWIISVSTKMVSISVLTTGMMALNVLDLRRKKMSTKQVIVVRKDLNMRKGKIAAQAAHASLKIFFDRMHSWNFTNGSKQGSITFTDAMYDWTKGSFTKICVYVESEEELLTLYKKAQDADIPCSLITDAGNTEFHGVPTHTCIAVGPDYSDKVDEITGGLPLL